MLAQLRPAASLLAIFTLLTGVIYPVTMTALAQLAFPEQANGSLLLRSGQAVGSTLIGQSFTEPRYFWGRPSATSPGPYNAAASSGSNLGPTNPALISAVRERAAALGAENPVPVDLVTSSGSGLDPHISPAAAGFQIARVARVRGLPEAQLETLVRAHTEARTLGILGEPRVNVLQLNLALDELSANPHERRDR